MSLRGQLSGARSAISVRGSNAVESIKTATISGGTGTLQWARYDATTGAYISDIAGQTGSTYTVQPGDVGFIIGAYLTSYQAFSHGTTPVPNINNVNVLVVAGQSQTNSNGTTGTDMPANLTGPMPDIYIWNPFTNQFGNYQPGVNSSPHINGGGQVLPEYWGPEAEFARRWKIDNPGVPLYIVKHARSASALSALATGAAGFWQVSANDLYVTLKSAVINAKASLTASGFTPLMRSFLWVQGESDLGIANAYNNYQTNMTDFITAVRTDYLGANCPFVIGRVQFISANTTGSNTVRAAQQAVGETASNCRWADLDGLQLSADAFHWGPTGVQEMGQRLYDASAIGTDLVAKYVARMTTPATAPDQALMATMLDYIIRRGAWSTIAYMNLYTQDTEQAALLNIKPGVTQTSQNLGMTFVPRIGFVGNGLTTKVDTGVIPSSSDGLIRPASSAYSWYTRTDAAGTDIGSNGAGCGILFGFAAGSTGSFRLNNDTTSASITFPANGNGVWTMSRTSNSLASIYRNGTKLGDELSPNGNSLAPLSVWIGNRNNSNNAGGTKSYQMFVGGKGMTTYQAAALSTAVTTYMAAMGAN